MKKNQKKKRGKFIVIDGTDGSGKATQVNLLARQLRKKGKKVKTVDFPQYYKNFFGKMVGECLVGKYGDWTKLDPHLASVIYAADRMETAPRIKKWLEEGNIVIADRYTSSNQIHQGGKILKGAKRKEFLQWLEKLEFGVFKIPRPDLIVYLDVPLDQSQRLMKEENNYFKKRYQKDKKDLHENDSVHLENAKKSALKMIKENNNWTRINCIKRGQLMTKEEIRKLMEERVKEKIKI